MLQLKAKCTHFQLRCSNLLACGALFDDGIFPFHFIFLLLHNCSFARSFFETEQKFTSKMLWAMIIEIPPQWRASYSFFCLFRELQTLEACNKSPRLLCASHFQSLYNIFEEYFRGKNCNYLVFITCECVCLCCFFTTQICVITFACGAWKRIDKLKRWNKNKADRFIQTNEQTSAKSNHIFFIVAVFDTNDEEKRCVQRDHQKKKSNQTHMFFDEIHRRVLNWVSLAAQAAACQYICHTSSASMCACMENRLKTNRANDSVFPCINLCLFQNNPCTFCTSIITIVHKFSRNACMHDNGKKAYCSFLLSFCQICVKP